MDIENAQADPHIDIQTEIALQPTGAARSSTDYEGLAPADVAMLEAVLSATA